jgi:hypothetical protein
VRGFEQNANDEDLTDFDIRSGRAAAGALPSLQLGRSQMSSFLFSIGCFVQRNAETTLGW